MGNVIGFGNATTLDLTPEKVLSAALDELLDHVIIIGWGEGGPYHASTLSDIPEMLFRVEMFKRQLLECAAST